MFTDATTPFPSMTSTTRPRCISNASTSSPPLSSSPSLSSTSSSSMRTVRTYTSRPQPSNHRRPSLDHIASRSERISHVLRTPTRHRAQSSPINPDQLYDKMPSSPLSPIGDREREYVDFTLRKQSKGKPTLEWACAAARVSGRRNLGVEDDKDIEPMLLDAGGDTEDEGDVHEAITPSSSQGREAKIWRSRSAASTQIESPSDYLLATPKAKGDPKLLDETKPQVATADADVMDAALALCGLGTTFSSSSRT
ncbi:hypothetical protein BDY19DRAFT_916532 [Irpex rosettiformis]|uniref:Uncharacterized protein n=1 Tax=Irpex rosettiformis TaxID=378272 RepID=A0ACB8ULA5_9APHY|nr:hypothetical protein BDY19DRAFT_916532 [Irpex rosettiformis]